MSERRQGHLNLLAILFAKVQAGFCLLSVFNSAGRLGLLCRRAALCLLCLLCLLCHEAGIRCRLALYILLCRLALHIFRFSGSSFLLGRWSYGLRRGLGTGHLINLSACGRLVSRLRLNCMPFNCLVEFLLVGCFALGLVSFGMFQSR
jgi:hypothetical protein